MSIGLVGTDTSSLEEAANLIKRAAAGETPGIEFGEIEQEDLIKAESSLREADGKAESEKSGPALSLVCYAGAALRDINYALVGRKYLRAAGINSRQTSIDRRALAIAAIEAYQS